MIIKMDSNQNLVFDLTSDSNVVEETRNQECKGKSNLPVETKGEDSIETRLSVLQETLNSIKVSVSSAISELKQIDKAYTKEKKKKAEKQNGAADNSTNDGNRRSKRPSGFARPVEITDELCVFMGIKEGTKVARTEVTRFLNKYITDNTLQNTQAKTKINADDRLKKLLRLDKEELTYFNLQKYMNKHFV